MNRSVPIRHWLTLMALLLPLAAPAQETAREHLEAGRYEQAIDSARQSLEDGGLNAAQTRETRRILAEALTATGAIDQARDSYRQLGGDDLRARVALARLEHVYGSPVQARRDLDVIYQDFRSRERDWSAPELMAAAEAARLLARRDPALYSAALEILERAIRLTPDDPAPHVAMGNLLLERYNNREALAAYRDALERDPAYPPALLGLARSRHFDRSSEAVVAVASALEVQPDLVPARVLLARLHLESEDYPAAREEIDRALAVNPRDPGALTLAAALDYLRGDDEGFNAALERVLELAPGYTEPMITLAEIAAQNRRYQDAVRFARGAVAIDARAWRGYALGGINLLRLGEVAGARRLLEVAFQGDPFDVWTKNTLELIDRIGEHETLTSERFLLVADGREARIMAPYLLEIAEAAYDHYAQRYDYRPPTPIRIEVYPRHEDFSVRTVGLVGVDILGVSFGPVVAFDSPSARLGSGPFNWASVLWHELAHSFHLGLTRGRVPRWFSEGLAVFEEHRARPGWGGDVSPGFLAALHEGKLNPISDLNRSFLRPSYPQQVIHAYYQGYLLMELIEQRHGSEAIVALLRGYRDGKTTPQLVREVLDLTPEELDRAFENFVRRRYEHALNALFAPQGEGPYPVLLKAGREALEAGDGERARELLERARELFPEHAGPDSPYRLLADLHREAGRLQPAIEQLEGNIAVDADDLEAHRQLADLYRETGQREAAAATLEKALLIQPFDPELHARLADIRAQQQRWPQTARARRAVVELDPPDPVEARYQLARALERAGEREQARREVLATLENAPLYEDALELLLHIRHPAISDEESSP